MTSDPDSREQWERVAAELAAYRTWQRQTWGDLDDATLGRYLTGEATPEERDRVEAALGRHPEVNQLLALVREVLNEPFETGTEEKLPPQTSLVSTPGVERAEVKQPAPVGHPTKQMPGQQTFPGSPPAVPTDPTG